MQTTTDIMTMLEAFIREQQALRQVDLQSMERSQTGPPIPGKQ